MKGKNKAFTLVKSKYFQESTLETSLLKTREFYMTYIYVIEAENKFIDNLLSVPKIQ